jgi:hypothetical protein
MVLTSNKWLYNKLDHGIINELKYIILTQTLIVAHNVTHLLAWSIKFVLLQI